VATKIGYYDMFLLPSAFALQNAHLCWKTLLYHALLCANDNYVIREWSLDYFWLKL